MEKKQTGKSKKAPFVKIVTKDGEEFQGILFQINKQNKTISLKMKGENSDQENMIVFKSSNIKDLKVFKETSPPVNQEKNDSKIEKENSNIEENKDKSEDEISESQEKQETKEKNETFEKNHEKKVENEYQVSKHPDDVSNQKKEEKNEIIENETQKVKLIEQSENENKTQNSTIKSKVRKKKQKPSQRKSSQASEYESTEDEMDLQNFQHQTENGMIEKIRLDLNSKLPKVQYNKEEFFDNITLENREDRRRNQYGRNRTNQATFDMTKEEIQESLKEQRKFMRRGRRNRRGRGRGRNNPRYGNIRDRPPNNERRETKRYRGKRRDNRRRDNYKGDRYDYEKINSRGRPKVYEKKRNRGKRPVYEKKRKDKVPRDKKGNLNDNLEPKKKKNKGSKKPGENKKQRKIGSWDNQDDFYYVKKKDLSSPNEPKLQI